MKTRIFFATLFAAVILLPSCITTSSSSKTTTTSSTSAYEAGRGFGTALSALYTQYKSTRKIDLTDATTVINLASLATYSTSIKGNMKNATYYKNFSAGAIAGSGNLITNATVNNIITLASGMDLSSIVSGKNVTATSAAITSTLLTIFGFFGK